MTAIGQTLTGNSGNDILSGTLGADSLAGLAGNDLLIGYAGGDTIDGGDGNDIIDSGVGDDSLIGGKGNDLIIGGSGNDTFVTNFTGAGKDVLIGIENLVVPDSIAGSDSLIGYANANDLILTYEGNTTDSITIKDLFDDSGQYDTITPAYTPTDTTTHPPVTYYQCQMNGDEQVFYKDSLDNIYYVHPDGSQNKLDGYLTYASQIAYLNNFNPLSFKTSGNTYRYIYNINNVMTGMQEFNTSGKMTAEYEFDLYSGHYSGSYVKTAYTYGGNGNVTSTQIYRYDNTGLIEDYELDAVTNFTSSAGTGNVVIPVAMPRYSGASGQIFSKGNDTQLTITDASTGSVTDVDLGYSTITGGIQVTGTVGNNTVIVQKYDTDNNPTYSQFTNEGAGTIDTTTYVYAGSRLMSETFVKTNLAGTDTLGDSEELYYYVNDTDKPYLLYKSGTLVTAGDYSFTDILGSNHHYTGTNGSDLITGSYNGNDTIDGGKGDDYIQGQNGNDSLYGGAGNDSVYGGSANDIINGGAGADLMAGYDGNDTYFVDNIGDIVNEVSNTSSIDTLISSVNYTLGNYTENLTLATGGSNLNGTGNGLDNIITGNNGKNILMGDAGNDTLSGGNNNDTLYGGANNDLLSGGTGNDILYGEVGNDTITGDEGNDVIYGGTGNDSLNGGKGNDFYWLYSGDGNDTITDNSGNSTVRFNDSNLSDITDLISGNISTTITGNADNYVTVATSGDTARVEYNHANHVTFQLQDGLSLDLKNYSAFQNSATGTNGNDAMYISNPADTIDGGAGNDLIIYRGSSSATIYGGTGNDIISAGVNYDYLEGGAGNDIYEIGSGSGWDKVIDTLGTNTVKLSDLNLSDIQVSPSLAPSIGATGFDLELIVPGQTVWIDGLYKNSTILQFADGISIDMKNYADRYVTNNDNGSSKSDFMYIQNAGNDSINGGAGNDLIIYHSSVGATLVGGAGNDILVGGAGNDTLDGGPGNDTYLFNAGKGSDLIKDSAGTDTVLFGTGVTLEDIAIYRDTLSGNTYLDYGHSAGNDKITINAGSRIERLQTSDGSYLTYKDIDGLIHNMASYLGSHTSITGVGAVKSDSTLMTMIDNSWHLSTSHVIPGP